MATCSVSGSPQWRDWCPLCGRRFQAETAEEIYEQIMDHMESKDGKPSECQQNFRPLREVLADDHY